LENKSTEKPRQVVDKKVSLEALQIVNRLRLPKALSLIKYEVLSIPNKIITINNVQIKIAPDVILKGDHEGKTVYGALKIHVCKGKPFELEQGKYVGYLLQRLSLNM